MINAILAADECSLPNAIGDEGIYLPYGGKVVWDVIVNLLSDIPEGATILGAWDYETGAIVSPLVPDFASIQSDGQLTDKHLWAGQAPRLYS